MLTYRPGDSLAHRLDPRTKLAFQATFAVAAFAHTTPRGLAALTGVVALVAAGARLSPVRALREVRYALPFLLAGPAIEAVRLGPPWVAPAAAVPPALASYRVLLVLLVGAAYVRTTPVRETRAAIQWAVPGRTGQALGTGVAFVVRFLPVVLADARESRRAVAARLGTERPLRERMALVASLSVRRALARADRFALALRARCLAWNPTLPPLQFRRADWPVLFAAVVLAAWTLAGWVVAGIASQAPA